MSDTSGDLSPFVFVVCENPFLFSVTRWWIWNVESLMTCVRGTFLATDIKQKQHSKRCSRSRSSPFSDNCIVRSKISAGCGCSLQLVILFDTFFIPFEISSKFYCLLYAASRSIWFTQMQICFSRKIDQCRKLSRLSLDFTELFATAEYTRYFVSAVL